MMDMVAAEYDPDNKLATPSVHDWCLVLKLNLSTVEDCQEYIL
jgi:hypothetical protein